MALIDASGDLVPGTPAWQCPDTIDVAPLIDDIGFRAAQQQAFDTDWITEQSDKRVEKKLSRSIPAIPRGSQSTPKYANGDSLSKISFANYSSPRASSTQACKEIQNFSTAHLSVTIINSRCSPTITDPHFSPS